ncbi:MAG: CPBP family intramembrane metalloprotease [Nanoarchaeota archaeon]|nr:CPBP family intramembrane metalloprotease [Nanoarchaeota archaeon]
MVKNNVGKGIIPLLVLGLFLAVFVLVNAQELVWGAFIYIVIGMVSIFLYSQWGKIGSKSDLEGIGDNFFRNMFIGFGLGIGMVILGSIFSFVAIGIPSVPQSLASTTGRFIVICILAPLFETIFFMGFFMDLLNSKFGLPKWLSIIISGLVFSSYHLLAYSSNGSISATLGSFVSAWFMGMLFCLVTEKTHSMIPALFFHIVLNIWIGFVVLSVIVLNILPLIIGII